MLAKRFADGQCLVCRHAHFVQPSNRLWRRRSPPSRAGRRPGHARGSRPNHSTGARSRTLSGPAAPPAMGLVQSRPGNLAKSRSVCPAFLRARWQWPPAPRPSRAARKPGRQRAVQPKSRRDARPAQGCRPRADPPRPTAASASDDKSGHSRIRGLVDILRNAHTPHPCEPHEFRSRQHGFEPRAARLVLLGARGPVGVEQEVRVDEDHEVEAVLRRAQANRRCCPG